MNTLFIFFFLIALFWNLHSIYSLVFQFLFCMNYQLLQLTPAIISTITYSNSNYSEKKRNNNHSNSNNNYTRKSWAQVHSWDSITSLGRVNNLPNFNTPRNHTNTELSRPARAHFHPTPDDFASFYYFSRAKPPHPLREVLKFFLREIDTSPISARNFYLPNFTLFFLSRARQNLSKTEWKLYLFIWVTEPPPPSYFLLFLYFFLWNREGGRNKITSRLIEFPGKVLLGVINVTFAVFEKE